MSNMSVNSSHSSNSSNSSLDSCLNTERNLFNFTGLFIIHILFLPLFILVLYVGCWRWRKRRSVSRAVTTSHSDILTFNMVALELINILGSCFFSLGNYTNQPVMVLLGFSIFSIILPGQSLFHLLACLERYLAIVHPITYLGLRQVVVIRIRNITIGCVWLICFGTLGLMRVLIVNFTTITNILLMVFSAIVVSFCSLSAVCVLIRPGPGNRTRVDRLKQRAFHTMVALTGTLLLKFLSSLVSTVLLGSAEMLDIDLCLVWLSAVWFSLPSSLVLPLLFLHRAGKLPGCK